MRKFVKRPRIGDKVKVYPSHYGVVRGVVVECNREKMLLDRSTDVYALSECRYMVDLSSVVFIGEDPIKGSKSSGNTPAGRIGAYVNRRWLKDNKVVSMSTLWDLEKSGKIVRSYIDSAIYYVLDDIKVQMGKSRTGRPKGRKNK